MVMDQKDFLAALGTKIDAVRQDISLPILEELLSEGYTNTKWNTNIGATDGPCISKNGDEMPLAEFIATTQYGAAIFSRTHPQCNCSITVSGPNLPDVEVNGYGRVG